MDTANRWSNGTYAVRLTHLTVGWRYWAFRRHDGADVEAGLFADGYPSMEAAVVAVQAVCS